MLCPVLQPQPTKMELEMFAPTYSGAPESFLGWSSVPHLPDDDITVDAPEPILPLMCLDAANLGDIPARYTIPIVPENAFPAIGVYLDKRIVPGFRYRVRVLPYPDNDAMQSYYLFSGAALRLDSIGRGYSRRLNFEPTTSVSDNDNYLWADSHPGGVALELHVISEADVFQILAPSEVLLGECVVLAVISQDEISQDVEEDFVRKSVRVDFECRIRWLDDRIHVLTEKVSGIAECVKKKGGGAAKVVKITIGNGLKLAPPRPGYSSITVGSDLVGGLPCTYKINGILDTEFPVIGTYVDPRIIPGFKYTVRKIPSKDCLFQGNALRLQSIGIGYGKRIVFEADEGTLNEPDNYFWSDSSPEGYAFQPVAVEEGNILKLLMGGYEIGDAEIVKIISPQKLIQRRLTTSSVEVDVNVDLLCRWRRKTGNIGTNVRVTGTALLSKPYKSRSWIVVCIRDLEFLSPVFLQTLAIKNGVKCVFLPA